jgi:hypothetical protein
MTSLDPDEHAKACEFIQHNWLDDINVKNKVDVTRAEEEETGEAEEVQG